MKSFILIASILVSCTKVPARDNSAEVASIAAGQAAKVELEALKKVQADDERLAKHVATVMAIHGVKMSDTLKMVTVRTLVQVAREVFDDYVQRENWIIVIGNESKFNEKAKSPVGAEGLGQIMPKYAKEFAVNCGIKNFNQDDLGNSYVNALLSACLFKQLVIHWNGSVTLALSSYNAGLASSATSSLQRLSNINPETSNYIARFFYVREKVKELSGNEASK